MATIWVPHILDLARSVTAADQSDADANSILDFRVSWKQYLARVLPHAERGVRSFMLTCIAEGRGADEEEERGLG